MSRTLHGIGHLSVLCLAGAGRYRAPVKLVTNLDICRLYRDDGFGFKPSFKPRGRREDGPDAAVHAGRCVVEDSTHPPLLVLMMEGVTRMDPCPTARICTQVGCVAKTHPMQRPTRGGASSGLDAPFYERRRIVKVARWFFLGIVFPPSQGLLRLCLTRLWLGCPAGAFAQFPSDLPPFLSRL